jgi:MoxR-like ATPase
VLHDRTERIVVRVDVASTVVTDTDEQVEAVAPPLDPHPSGVAGIDEGEHGVAHDRTGGMRDLARKRAAVRGRRDELYIEVSVAQQRSEVPAQPFERTRDRFE